MGAEEAMVICVEPAGITLWHARAAGSGASGGPAGDAIPLVSRLAKRGPHRVSQGPGSEEELASLVERARAGDESAFGELFAEHRSDVARMCRRMLGDGVSAEDATQEIFLRARGGLESFDPTRPFRQWLLGVANHHCIDRLRRRRTESRLFDARDLHRGDLVDPGPTPLGQLARREQRDEVLRAIDALPLKYRLPLVLRYFNELDYTQIGELLAVTRNQVGTLLFRAKRMLRQEMMRQQRAER